MLGDDLRIPKRVYVEDKVVSRPDGEARTIHLAVEGGSVALAKFDVEGKQVFVPLARVRTYRRGWKGLFRWYNDYRLPPEYRGRTVRVRRLTDEEDKARGLNRTKNVRLIPPTDVDFHAFSARPNDSESINRGLDDSMWDGRAHSVGHARQLVELLGYAVMVNGLALLLDRRRRAGRPGRVDRAQSVRGLGKHILRPPNNCRASSRGSDR